MINQPENHFLNIYTYVIVFIPTQSRHFMKLKGLNLKPKANTRLVWELSKSKSVGLMEARRLSLL